MARKPTPEERAFALGVAAGAKAAREKELLQALLTASEFVLRSELAEVVALVLDVGVAAALEALDGLVDTWRRRWTISLQSPLYSIMDEAPVVTDRGPAKLPLDVRSERSGGFFSRYLEKLAELVTRTSRDRVGEVLEEARREGMSVERAAQRLREAEPELTTQRATFIARNELVNASRAAAHEKARSSGVVSHRSRHASSDRRVRDSHERWDGEKVTMDEKYSSGEWYPGELEFGCRCGERFYLKPELLENPA